ncbi:MAG: 30S ribosomal protein S13 [Candidatus Woesearchaeota archaeon]|jgi:small subunit ribosomal protein S13
MVDEKQFRHVVNIASTDINGDKKLLDAIRQIRGVSFMYGNAIILVSGYDRSMKVGYLSKEEVLKFEDILKNPKKYNIPIWLLNRRKDFETGEDLHVVGATLSYTVENDIKQLKKIRCWRGIRHSANLPVRGQRVKSNFRKTKSANSKRKKR